MKNMFHRELPVLPPGWKCIEMAFGIWKAILEDLTFKHEYRTALT